MALDIYFVENIARILYSVSEAGGGITALISEEVERDDLTTGELTDHLRLYRRGYKDALAAVALAFGIEPEAHRIDQRGGPLPVIIKDCVEYLVEE